MKKLFSISMSGILAVFILALTGCPSSGTTLPILTIKISGETTMEVGSTITLSAQKEPTISTSPITWSASDPSIVTITESNTTCTVKALKAGTVTITAKSTDSVGTSAAHTIIVTGDTVINEGTGVYVNFYNYPTGKQDPNGTLNLKNLITEDILVFADSVSPENYIATVNALGTATVKLTSERFYTIIAVQKTIYEQNPERATQTSKLAYYSDTQGYTVSISAENLSGSGTWIINNATNYWASIESLDGQETYAVIAPRTQRVKIPVQTSKSYDYKIVYKKELKYSGKTLAITEVSRQEQNDTAVFKSANGYQFTTDLSLSLENEYAKLSPSVQLINNSGKSLRVYKGNIQVTSFGELDSEDYVCVNGETAFFTGFDAGATADSIGIRSVAWPEYGLIKCDDTKTFSKGKVYVVTVSSNTSGSSSPVKWSITEKNASEVYDQED